MAWTFASPIPDAANPTAGRHILLVSEYDILFELQLLQLMENVGWSIAGPAASIQEAESLLEQRHPDVAILNAKTGGGCVHALAERLIGRRVPLIFCSDEEEPKLSSLFVDSVHLAKPVAVHSLYAAIQRLSGSLETA